MTAYDDEEKQMKNEPLDTATFRQDLDRVPLNLPPRGLEPIVLTAGPHTGVKLTGATLTLTYADGTTVTVTAVDGSDGPPEAGHGIIPGPDPEVVARNPGWSAIRYRRDRAMFALTLSTYTCTVRPPTEPTP